MHAKRKPDPLKEPVGDAACAEPTAPYWDDDVDRIMAHYENQAYHHVDHTETYNKPWVDGEKQMTLEEIGKHVEFIKRCMGMAGVALLAVLLITLIK